jgi:hypothetical protein
MCLKIQFCDRFSDLDIPFPPKNLIYPRQAKGAHAPSRSQLSVLSGKDDQPMAQDCTRVSSSIKKELKY